MCVCVCETERERADWSQPAADGSHCPCPVVLSPPTKTHIHSFSRSTSLSLSFSGSQPGRTFSCNCLLLSFQHGRSAVHYRHKCALQGVDACFRVFGFVFFSSRPPVKKKNTHHSLSKMYPIIARLMTLRHKHKLSQMFSFFLDCFLFHPHTNTHTHSLLG